MRLIYLTNIPTPYRNLRFNIMAAVFERYNITFEVLYQARTEPNRQWKIDADSFKYRYKFFKGLHFRISNFYAHFNPALLLRLLRKDYDVAIIGGFGSPTLWLAPIFIGSKPFTILSIESNLSSVQRITGIAKILKRTFFKKADAYQVTGLKQKDYIKYFYPEFDKKPMIVLPNIIDSEIYHIKVAQMRTRKDNLRKVLHLQKEERMWLMPARLITEKGIIPFLKCMKGIDNVKLYILGDGLLKHEIQAIINEFYIRAVIVPFVQQKEILMYYATADLFVLPSFKDPSPLSPIEAIAASLPVLVSNQLGNIDDVYNGLNGWKFDPYNSEEVKNSIELAAACSTSELLAKGEESSKIYLSIFESKRCIEQYAIQLKKSVNV